MPNTITNFKNKFGDSLEKISHAFQFYCEDLSVHETWILYEDDDTYSDLLQVFERKISVDIFISL